MEGGVVVIKFEADTAKVEESLKKIEKTATKVSSATSKATKRANDEEVKAARRKYRNEVQFRKEAADAAKKAAEFAKRAQRVEADEAKKTANIMKQLNREKMQIAENERKQDLAKVRANARLKAQIEKDVAKQVRQQNAANAKALRESNKSIEQFAATIYSAKFAIKMIADGMKGTWDATKGAANTALTWYKNLLKATSPLQTITGHFLKISGILDRIKSKLSFDSLFNFGKSSVEAASDLTEVQNIVDTAFPNMSKEMQDWADDSINAFGLSEKSAKQYASTLGLMAQSAGLAEKASYKLGTGLTAVTADLASMYNMRAEDVYEKIRSGVIGGRTMAIAQLGINMNQANLQAYMMSKGITESFNSLDNATKTAIRYNYVIEQTRKIQGDFVKTQGTWANQTRILAENFTALKASIGTFLVSALTPLIQLLNQFLQVLTKAVNKLIEFLPLIGIKIQKAAGSNGAGSGIESLSDDLTELGDEATAAQNKLNKLTDGPFSEMHKLGTDDAASGISKLKDLFGGSGLLDYENPYTLELLNPLEAYIKKIMKLLDLSELKNTALNLLKDIKRWIEDIGRAWKKVWERKGADYLQSVINLLNSILSLIDDIGNAFDTVWNSGYGETILDRTLKVATDLNNTIDNIVKKFKTFWNSGSGHFANVLTEQGQLNSRKLTPEELAQGKRQTNGQHTPDAFRTHTGVDGASIKASESELRELTWGEYLAAEFLKVQVAILDTIDAVIRFVDTINSYLNWDTIGAAGVTILDAVAESLNKISNWLEQHSEVAEKIAKIIENIATGFANAVEDVLTFITDHLDVFEDFVDLMLKLSEHTEEILLFGAALKLLGPIIAGLGKVLLGTMILSKIGITSGLGSLGSTIISKIGGFITRLPAKIGEFLTTVVESGDFFGGGILIAGIFELGSILTSTVKETVEKICDGGWQSLSDFFGWFFLELPDKVRGPITNLFSRAVVFLATKGKEINEKIGAFFRGLIEDIGGWFKDIWDTVSGWVKSIAEKISSVVTSIKEGLNTAKDFLTGSSTVNIAHSYASGIPSGHSTSSHYDFSGKHANGGVWAPNSPAFAVLGDQSAISGNEYALTEQHLDNIANRMTSAIMSGFARANLAGAGGGNQPINIYIGDEQIKDFIVKSVDENNYRRF